MASDDPPGRYRGDDPIRDTGDVAPAAAIAGRDTLFAHVGERTPDETQAGAREGDAVGCGPDAGGAVAAFRFDADVARVFPDMLDRSIPGYASVVAQTGLLAARFARPRTCLYDLGCSLGASALAMRSALATRAPDAGEPLARHCVVHGVDNSPAMLARAHDLVAAAERATAAGVIAPPVHLHEADLVTHPLARCSVVAMNFTLQFVPPDARAALLERIARALVPGGALILSEKLRFEDPRLDALHADMYHAFKRANGYSALEIARKRAALENVLVPDTLAEHERRLGAAGFARTSVWFQCFNFVSLIAIRD